MFEKLSTIFNGLFMKFKSNDDVYARRFLCFNCIFSNCNALSSPSYMLIADSYVMGIV